MKGFLKSYALSNPEKFNKEFIYQKKNDSILSYLEDTCKSLEIIDGIKFIKGEIITDESKFATRTRNKEKYITLEESRYDLVLLHFHISGIQDKEYKEMDYTIELYTAKIINDFYYLLNGSKYYPIYQIIDAATYHTKNSLTQKSLLMPIVVQTKPTLLMDINEIEYNGKGFTLFLFTYKLNIFHYYFAKFGFYKTLEYFGYQDKVKIVEGDSTPSKTSKIFKVNKTLEVHISNSLMKSEEDYNIILSLIDILVLTTGVKLTTIDNIEFWKKKLGATFTKTTDIAAQIEKAERILISFERILDNGTKKTLRIADTDKEDTFAIVRYMVRNYKVLTHIDNMDLHNKRLRLKEHEIQPWRLSISAKTYQLLNSKLITFEEKLRIMVNISNMFLIKNNITNPLMRYCNNVNGIDLISALKFSMRGPQSISETGKSVNVKYRNIHSSYIGRIGLTTCSNGDPGLTGSISPFIKTYGYFFSEKDEFITISDEDNDTDDFVDE